MVISRRIIRIHLMTKRVNWNEPYDILITRPSIYGNPYSHKEGTSAEFKVSTKREAVDKFRKHFEASPELQVEAEALRGKRIACQCSVGSYCHGDVYVDYLERRDIIKIIEEL